MSCASLSARGKSSSRIALAPMRIMRSALFFSTSGDVGATAVPYMSLYAVEACCSRNRPVYMDSNGSVA